MDKLVTRVTWSTRQAGDVGLLLGTGLISDAIIKGEQLAGEGTDGTWWSHAFIVSNGSILEAIYPKISLSPWNVYDDQVTAVFRINAAAQLKQTALLDLIHEYVGKGYDLTGCALGMASLEIMRALHIEAENNPFANQHKEWCSELATRYIEKLLPDPAKPSTTDPQAVYNYLNSLVYYG